jgi:hypothetical protein
MYTGQTKLIFQTPSVSHVAGAAAKYLPFSQEHGCEYPGGQISGKEVEAIMHSIRHLYNYYRLNQAL